ncbi:cytochrome [Sesamum alatum]|uniref:Cytochrome n=1 Tax=Sesamum alatum TaxID=300844 RepID=A0AAE2CMZ4_9LAMI|nr:cytochrome [Sesamum alatum]
MEAFDHLCGVLFALLVLFSTWYFFTRRLRLRGKMNLPPSPPKLPVIGNLHQLGQSPHRSLWDLSKKYGPMMLLHFGSKPALIISSADAAREILRTHDVSFASRPELTSLKRVFYDMQDVINLPYGDKWRKLRSIFVHRLLSSTRVKSFSSVREEEIALLVEKIKQCCLSASPVNLTDMFFSLTSDLISRAAFGKKYSETQYGQEILAVMQEIAGLLFNFTIGEFVPWLGWIDWLNGFNASLDRCTKRVDKVLDAVIEEQLNWPGEPDESKENFLEILLDMYRGNVPGVSIDLLTVKTAILETM